MKRLVSLLVALLICMSFVSIHAEEPEYSIRQLQELAVANSSQAKLDDIDIKARELDLKNVKSDLNVLNDMILLEIRPMELSTALDMAKRNKQNHIKELRLDIYKMSLQILLGEKQKIAEEEKMKILQERLTLAQARYKSKAIVMDDLTQAEYNVMAKQVDINNVKAAHNTLYTELGRLTGIELDTEAIALSDELKVSEFKLEDDLNVLIDGAVERDSDVYDKRETLKAKQKGMEIAARLYRQGDTPYDSSVIDLSTAEINYKDTVSAVQTNIQNKYNDLLNKRDDLELAGKYLELCKKRLDNAKTKYGKGVLSKEALLPEQENYLNAEYANYRAIYEFNILKAEFENLV